MLGELKAAMELGVGSEIAAGWAARLSCNGLNTDEAPLYLLRAEAKISGNLFM